MYLGSGHPATGGEFLLGMFVPFKDPLAVLLKACSVTDCFYGNLNIYQACAHRRSDLSLGFATHA
jgi:hypothetical protein